uniref:hypothetical protein n=2 Tax=Pseudomonadota TaxID=1224 RepID=UPI0019540610
IQDESAQIQEILGKRSPRELSGIDRRVRVVFADDNDREYTNQIVDMMQFLQDIEGSIVFDPQKNDLME